MPLKSLDRIQTICSNLCHLQAEVMFIGFALANPLWISFQMQSIYRTIFESRFKTLTYRIPLFQNKAIPLAEYQVSDSICRQLTKVHLEKSQVDFSFWNSTYLLIDDNEGAGFLIQ